MSQLSIGFFQFHRADLQLFDKVRDALIVTAIHYRFFVGSGTISHYFRSPEIMDGSPSELHVSAFIRIGLFGKFNIRLHGLSVKAMLLF